MKDQRTVTDPSDAGGLTVGSAVVGGRPQSTRVGISVGPGNGVGMVKRCANVSALVTAGQRLKARIVTW